MSDSSESSRSRKPLRFLRAAKRDYDALPNDVQDDAGYNLDRVQQGKNPEISFKPLHGLGGGIMELRLSYHTDAFRVVYVARLSEAVFVLDAFKKKSPSGNRLPRNVEERIKERYKLAKAFNKQLKSQP